MSQTKRILLIANIFPPEIGGPATFISTVARKLSVERGSRVTVICASGTDDPAADRILPFRVRRMRQSSVVRRHLLLRWTLVRELLRHDLVLVNGFENVVYPIAKALGRRYVLKVPGDSVWQMGRNAGVLTIDIDAFQTDPAATLRYAPAIARRNAIAAYARHVVTPSDYLLRMVHGWGVPAERITTIPNGVDLARFSNPIVRRGPGEPLRVLFVGRLTNWKGVETALLALRLSREAVLTVVGDGPEYPLLASLARQLNVTDRVTFAGRCPPEQVAGHMGRAHVLVLTSLYEGMSHTLQEAMAAGLVCVASDRGGNHEVIRAGQTGLLLPPEDAAALAEAWRSLHADESRRLAMAEQARQASAEFSMERTLESFLRLFDRLSQ